MSQIPETAVKGSSTVLKGLNLLRTIADFPHGATAAELASASEQPFSTAYRLLGTLTSAGFVEFDPRTRLYSLGVTVFELGQRVGHARGFTASATPVLKRLSAITQESCILAILDNNQTLTVNTIDGPQFRTTTDPGDRGPLNTSAIGKALLAWQTPERREELLAELQLTARTEKSITDRHVLAQQLALARERGWAEQCEEHDLGMAAIAVPVLRPEGTVVASLALAAPLFRANLEQLRAHVPEVQHATQELGVLLP